MSEANGRVNLIGEHTDYNGGFVLPMAIPQSTKAALRTRSDRMVVVKSALGEASYVLGDEKHTGTWIDYVAGTTWVLSDRALGGFDVEITSTIPMGSGLSSSAALEIAMLRALRDTFSLGLSDLDLALLARRAEDEYVGAPVGIMDPLACALADETHALFIDTRALTYERVLFPDDLDLVVIDSGIKHAHGTGEYKTRRAECERAARLLGVDSLRDATLERVGELPSPLRERARHVITENARVHETVRAMRARDAKTMGALFVASHASMRDDFAVSVPAIDRLVEIACADPDVFGARLTGGGFGGSIVAIAKKGSGAATRIADRGNGHVLVPA